MFCAAFTAGAMTAADDNELRHIAGQDGVSIAADLKIDIASFVYVDTDANGGSMSHNDIKFTGVIKATLDILSQAAVMTEAFAPNASSVLGNMGGADLPAFLPKGDVIKLAIPQITTSKPINISIASRTMGHSTASFGAIAINQMSLAGSTAYIWAH